MIRALVLLVCILVGGCGGAPKRGLVATEPTLEVLDAGAEPRQPLRYELALHVPESLALTYKVRITVSSASTESRARQRAVEFPTLDVVSTLEVTALAPDGTATVHSRVDQVTVPGTVDDPLMRQLVAAQVAGATGAEGTWHVTPSGRVSDPTIVAPNASRGVPLADVATTMQDSMVLFPAEAVGVGAIWEVRSKYLLSGVTWDRTSTYRLEALTAATATISASFSMHAGAQSLRVEPRSTTKLTSGSSSESAELVIPLHGLGATVSSTGTSELNFYVEDGRVRAASSVHTEITRSACPVSRSGR